MKKRKLSVLAMVLAATLTLSGGSPVLAEDEDFQEPVTVSLFNSETEEAAEALQTLIDRFNEENTYNITVEISSPADYETVMKTRMAANDLPDIFSTHGWAVRRYSEYLYDLSGESWADTVSSSVRDLITTDDGKLCVLPIGQANEGIQFNIDILNEYDINPEEIETWDDFVEALKKIRDESDGEIVPLYIAGSEPAIVGFFLNSLCAVNIGGNSEAEADKLLENSDFDWTYMEKIMDKYKELADEGLFNDGYMTAQVTDLIEYIATGKCAFAFLGTQIMEGAEAVNPDLNWGFIPYPAITELGTTEGALTNGEQGTFGIWKDSPNLEAARKVLEYLAQPENVAYYCSTASKPSGIDGVEVDFGDLTYWYEFCNQKKSVGQFDRTYLPNGCYDSLSDAMSKVLMGTLSSEEGVEQIKEEYDRLYGTDD